MNTIHRNPNERGSAILLVLGFLSLLLMMAMIFAVTSRNAQIAADAKADETNAQLQSRSAATQAQETIFFLQNKGNIIGSVNTDLQNCLPENLDIEQSPTELSDVDLYYGNKSSGIPDTDHLGLQPYVGYTTNELPNSWRFLAFYGELSEDAFATKPFEITTTRPYQSIYYSHAAEDSAADFDEVRTKDGSDYKKDDDGNYVEDENSLYYIVRNTALGKLYIDATGGLNGQFAQLLRDDKATQLQFRNFFETDSEDNNKRHVFSRQGFIMFNEGSKFDVNRMVSPETADASGTIPAYVPFVGGGRTPKELGSLSVGEPGTGLNIDAPGCSTYAIMGRQYGSDEYTSDTLYTELVEDETVQYGLHPLEFQTRIVGGTTIYEDGLECKNTNKSPRWFSYEHLINTNAGLMNAMKDDIFILGLESGPDDRELRFNGQYGSMGELLDSIGEVVDADDVDEDGDPDDAEDGIKDTMNMTSDGKIEKLNGIDDTPEDDGDCSYLAKTNIAFPWGVYCSGRTSSCSTFGCANPDWDDISSSLSALSTKSALKPYVVHFFNNHLGLKYDPDHSKYLFQEGSTDKTMEVFANLVDFCDSDSTLTYCAKVGTNKLTFATADMTADGSDNLTKRLTSVAPTPVISEPEICGNEKTPAVVGVRVEFDAAGSTDVNLSTETKNGSMSIPFIGSISIPGMCAMTISSGKAEFTPSITLSLQNFFGEELPSTSRNYRVIVEGEICPIILARQSSISYDHGIKRKYRNYLLIGGSTTLIPYGSENTDPTLLTDYGLSAENIKNASSVVGSNLATQARYFRVDKTMTHSGSFPECENFLLSGNAGSVKYPITGGTYGTTSVSLSGNHYFHTGSGYAVKITKIVVMGQEGTSGLSELAYMENPNEDWIVNYNLLYDAPDDVSNCSFSFPIESSDFVATDGATCRDPRMNHKDEQWVWMAPIKNASGVEISRLLSTHFTNPKTGDPREGKAAEKYSTVKFGASNLGYKDRLLARSYDRSTFKKYSLETVEDTLFNNGKQEWKDESGNDSGPQERDWEPDFLPCTSDVAISTNFIPNSPISSLWQLGAIHRGAEGQTINLKAFGTDGGVITHEYGDGDAWILDYLKLNELDANHGIRGKFNPNCFNAGAYRFLFANIPSNEDAEDTMIYANGFYDPATEVVRNRYYRNFIDITLDEDDCADLEKNVFRFKEVGSGKDYPQVSGTNGILAAQSWSPVQAFFNFVEIDGGTESSAMRTGTIPTTYQCNDRQAESLIGCTAGLLSTRYEVFTAIAVGQSVKFVMSEDELTTNIGEDGSAERTAFLKQIANPIRICFKQDSDSAYYEWYSILSTQVREVTFVRDCWFGKITVLKSRLL